MAEEQKKMNGCSCNHSWVARGILMVVILGIVFFSGVAAGELKATVRAMHGYGWKRGGWDGGRIPMMTRGIQADVYPDDILYE